MVTKHELHVALREWCKARLWYACSQDAEADAAACCGGPVWDVAELDGEVISVTLDTGERVYCGLADAPAESSGRGSAGGARDRAGAQHSGRLLTRPITELLRQAEDAAVARAVLASEKEPTSTPASAPDPGDAHPGDNIGLGCETLG